MFPDLPFGVNSQSLTHNLMNQTNCYYHETVAGFLNNIQKKFDEC